LEATPSDGRVDQAGFSSAIGHNELMARNHRKPHPEWFAAARPFANRWEHLAEDERERLLDQAEILTATRYWEGLDGTTVTPRMQALVSVRACVLTVNTDLSAFADVTSVLMAKAAQTFRTRQSSGGSIVTETEACVLGQALLHGPVRLSWEHVQADERRANGGSVVLHEFAHKVDMADGVTDGTPPIRSHDVATAFERARDDVIERLRSGQDGGPLRSYAATNRSEFFAVATEAFFLRPAELKASFSGLYDVFALYYRQDPAA
jgi:Mlc titration factor MtfA (ptsG expression regulator)